MKKTGIALLAAALLFTAACGKAGEEKTGGTAVPGGENKTETGTQIAAETLQENSSRMSEAGQGESLQLPEDGKRQSSWLPEAGQGESTPLPEESQGGTSQLSGADQEQQAARYQAVMEQLDWSRGPCYLDYVGDCLNRQSLPWVGYYNQTGERVDIALEDGSRLVLLDIKDDFGDCAGTVLIMVGDKFNDSAFQEGYLNQFDVTTDEEYYPETAYSLLSDQELEQMNQTDLSIIRNEIYARHGRRYEDPFLKAVFTRKSWYEPKYGGEEFSALEAGLLNSYETENLKKIVAREEELGCRQKEGDTSVRLLAIANGSSPDLDGDGHGETVYLDLHYSAPGRGDSYELFVYGKYPAESMETRRMDWVQPTIYTGSLDGKTTLLFACRKENENPPMTDVYSYQNETLHFCGMIPGNDITIKDGCLYARRERDKSQEEGEPGALAKYTIQDGQVKELSVK